MRSLNPITLVFPAGGVSRRLNYRKVEEPYATINAVNVRLYDPYEKRGRGGTRPGLKRITGVESEESGTWQWPNGETIKWPDGAPVQFGIPQATFAGPNGINIIDKSAAIVVTAQKGKVPDGYTNSCYFRDRVVVAKDDMWYASRVGDHSDWDYGGDIEDLGKALAGTLGRGAGRVNNDHVTAIIPFRDKTLWLATKRAIFAMVGDPVESALVEVSEETGIIAPFAWAMTPNGTIAFLGHDGIYVGGFDSAPAPFSAGRIPLELTNVDTINNSITMAWDATAKGFHLFITPVETSKQGRHYFFTIDPIPAIWDVVFRDVGHQPVKACRMLHNGIDQVALLCNDGIWRTFEPGQDTDDGEPIESIVTIGTIMLSPNDLDDTLLAEIHGVVQVDDDDSFVTWGATAGHDAEHTATRAKAGDFDRTGVWGGGRQHVERPRLRGPWCAITLQANVSWAFEAIVLRRRQLGRLRV